MLKGIKEKSILDTVKLQADSLWNPLTTSVSQENRAAHSYSINKQNLQTNEFTWIFLLKLPEGINFSEKPSTSADWWVPMQVAAFYIQSAS